MSLLVSFLLAGSVARGPSGAAVVNSPALPPPGVKAANDMLLAETRRIRSSEKRINLLLQQGVRRSRTFADLVTRIHRSNVIVYIESSHQLASDTLGRILLQTVAGGQRYLRVQVRSHLQGDHIIAVLAHEFHHALEVADDLSVVDDATLTQLYRRIGHESHGPQGFDTDAARAAGIRVRDELIG